MQLDSFISWIGGKKALRKRLLEELPQGIERYVEVFGGAGWLLFAKDRHAKMEVYNDVSGDLINLYRVVKYHPKALQEELAYSFVSREQFFDALRQQDVRGLTDIQRAARFFVMIKESYGNTLDSFGCRGRRMDAAIDYLTKAGQRLRSVVIENQDFARILQTYDRPGTLFYLDPPYYGTEKYYAEPFGEEEHLRFKECLEAVKGRFLLSYNDCPKIRELYKNYTILEAVRNNNLAAKAGGRQYKELIIRNY